MRRKLAMAVVGGVLLLSVFADCIASDRPIVLGYQGKTYWFPNLIDYSDLRELRGDVLRARMTRDDWALWAPVRHSPTEVRTRGQLELTQRPSSTHWLGTDDRGRDVLARLVHGTRSTVLLAAGVAVVALLFGLALGLFGAAVRGPAEAGVLAACDVALAIPALLLVVAAQGLIGTTSMLAVVLLIAVPRAADIARICLAGVTDALAAPFCQAARAMGASRGHILLRHALPQTYRQLAVATALTASFAVLAEAGLSFIGFGTPPPAPSWGELLKQAYQNDLRWWLALPAGAMVAVLAGALGALAQPDQSR